MPFFDVSSSRELPSKGVRHRQTRPQPSLVGPPDAPSPVVAVVASSPVTMKPIIAVPATAALVLRAWKKKSLTPAGLVAATLTAVAHAYHPWNLPFVLLCVFFLAGTRVTHVSRCLSSCVVCARRLASELAARTPCTAPFAVVVVGC